MIYRQVVDNVVVNRAVFDKSIPDDWPDREQYELETEDPPPQKGWTRPGPGEPFVEPPRLVELD